MNNCFNILQKQPLRKGASERERETRNIGIATTTQLLQKQPPRKGASVTEREREREPRNTSITVIKQLLQKQPSKTKQKSFTEREREQEHRHDCHNTHSFYRNSPQEKELQRERERAQEHRHNCHNTHSFYRNSPQEKELQWERDRESRNAGITVITLTASTDRPRSKFMSRVTCPLSLVTSSFSAVFKLSSSILIFCNREDNWKLHHCKYYWWLMIATLLYLANNG